MRRAGGSAAGTVASAHSLGLLAVLGASVLFGVNPALSKLLLDRGMSAACVVFWMHLCSACLNLGLVLVKRSGLVPRGGGRSVGLLLLTGAVGMGGTSFLLNMAYRFLGVGFSTLLHFTYPALVTLAMAVLFRERFTRYRALSIVVCALGLLLLTGTAPTVSVPGVLAALGSGVCYSIYIIVNERAQFAQQPVYRKMTFMAFGSSFVFGCQAIAAGTLRLPESWQEWVIIVCIGGSSALGYSLLTYGIQTIGASAAAFGTMLEPVTGVFMGAALYREPIGLATVIGSAFILSSVAFIRKGELPEQKKTEREP